MPESAEEVYARVIGQVGEHGRLPMPPGSQWDVFPYEGEMVPKVLQPPVEAEQPRSGEGDRPCWCETGEPASTIWRNERWIVASPDAPGGLPLILVLQPREHLDLSDLDDDRASELGRLTVRLHRIMAHLPNIGRVHVNKWGDGGSLQAAPTDAGLLPQVRASRPGEWSNTDLVITPAEGAEFNARLCGEFGQSNADNSKGVHNPFLCEALMIATINYIRSFYALPAASVSVEARMRGPIGGEFNGSMHISRTPPGEPISK